jgi:asparagine synthase (glutamine-hydrolysing)
MKLWERRATQAVTATSRFTQPGGLVGVYGVADPAEALRAAGVEPAWREGALALGGAAVWVDARRRLVVAGEVVLDNGDELRQQLGRPHAGALELLGELYARQGWAGFAAALGIFCGVVWDGEQQRLLLLRDGLGARTLYYAHSGRTWWFADRLRRLQQRPGASQEISLTALRDYLICAFVPGANTLWRDAREVRPGTVVLAPSGEAVSYWEPSESAWDPGEPLDAHALRLRPLLEQAVQARLPAAGPVGVFLSGGIDSSLVTAIAAKARPGQVHTYAIHFGEAHPNELAFSGLVAQHCQSQHHILALSAEEMQAHLPDTMLALDDPIGDPLTVPNLLLGRLAAQTNAVILNGEGGDPCFGGPKNLPMLLNELYAVGQTRETAYLRAYQKCYDDLGRLLRRDVRHTLQRARPPEALITPFLDNPAMTHFLNKLTHINIRLKGADHILTKVNNLTSANGVLGRSPLFDRRVVEASFAIPPQHKLAGTTEKAVLKQAVADLLPGAILARPKSGMLVPVQRWFRNELRAYARDLLLSRQARLQPYINQKEVQTWLDYRGELWPRHGVKLWLLLTLEVWLRIQA